MEQAAATTAERFGTLDVIFTNAGIAELSPLGRTSLETFDRVTK